jgi:Mn2+/Fe2+ NRAMP family transporter
LILVNQRAVKSAMPKMEVIRKLIPWDVWAAIVAAIVAVIFAVVFSQAPLSFFLVVALALCVYTAKILKERGPR